MKLLKNCLFLLLFIVFLANCAENDIKNEFPSINEVKAGSTFRIILPENHQTGYMWQLSQDYDKTNIRQINEVWHGNEKGIYFHLKALSIGQTKLTFISRKYTDTADIKHFIVKIVKN